MKISRSIPAAPGALPLLGHLPQFVRDPLGFLTSLPAHGDLVHVRLGRMSVVVVCDPELTQQVVRNDRIFDKGGLFFDQAREALGDGLITCPHSRHRRQRRMLQPAFHPTRMPGYAHAMATEITAVTESWRDGQVLDVLTEMMTITSKSVAATLFANALSPAALHHAIEDITTLVNGVYRRMLIPPALAGCPPLTTAATTTLASACVASWGRSSPIAAPVVRTAVICSQRC